MATPIRSARGRALTLSIAVALLAAVAWGVHRFVGWRTVAGTAQAVPASAWLAFVLLMAVSYAARVARLWRMLHDLLPGVRLARTAPVFFVHNAMATLLPARLGEVAMPILARRWTGADWAGAAGALAWWRLADVAVVAALAIALLATGATVLAPLYALALGACALPLVVFALRGALHRMLEARSARGDGTSRAIALAHRVLGGMPGRWTALAADLVLAALAWSAKLAAFTALIRGALAGAGIAPLPAWPYLAAAGLAGDAAAALPLPAFGGIGPFEAGVLLGLTTLGVESAFALALGVLLHGAVLASIVLTGLLGLALGSHAQHSDPS